MAIARIKIKAAALDAERQRELERASDIARQLETIAGSLRQDLANHHARLAGFKSDLHQAQEADNELAWQSVCSEAEAMLAPTMQLAQQMSMAYDSIRQQSDALETFSQARTDPATGIANVRALGAKARRVDRHGSTQRDRLLVGLRLPRPDTSDTTAAAERRHKARLIELAELIQSCMRDTDFVARYGDEELVVVMQQTTLSGACIFADRLRKWVVERLSATVSCGIAEYQMNDDKKSLLGRADSAFYSAKAAGGNCQFVHSGTHIREFCRAWLAAACRPGQVACDRWRAFVGNAARPQRRRQLRTNQRLARRRRPLSRRPAPIRNPSAGKAPRVFPVNFAAR